MAVQTDSLVLASNPGLVSIVLKLKNNIKHVLSGSARSKLLLHSAVRFKRKPGKCAVKWNARVVRYLVYFTYLDSLVLRDTCCRGAA
jgi:hypothetical protein